METQTLEVEFATTATEVDTTARELIELAAHELALVGGGTANVSFL
jgi:hypothetical protein